MFKTLSPRHTALAVALTNAVHFDTRPVVAGLIYDPVTLDILLVSKTHHPKQFTLIKGGIELDESPAKALMREATEEAGFLLLPEHIVAQQDPFVCYRNGGKRKDLEQINIVIAQVRDLAALAATCTSPEGRTVTTRHIDEVALDRHFSDVLRPSVLLLRSLKED